MGTLVAACKLLMEQLTVGTTVMKNCEPLVPWPAFAMLSVYGRSCLNVAWNSSSNSPPQMLSPPMPVPVGSPVWIINPCTQRRCRHRLSWQITAWMCFSHQVRKTYFDYSVEDVVIVVAIPAVDAEVLHSFGAPKKNRVKNCLYLVKCNADF